MTKTVVTSALPYANGPIHVGHLVEYIQTDIFVRALRLFGKDAIYCCADDTHGTPIEIKATELGIKPEELIEKVHKEHLRDFTKFSIRFDSYYSTNTEENKHFSDQIFNALKAKDLIYTKEVENFYDEEAKRFLPDRYVKGKCPKCGAEDQYGDVCEKCNATYKPIDLVDPYSTLTRSKPIRKTSMHYFFKLSALSEKLDRWLTENKNLQSEIVNYVRNWIKEGLNDWDISRDGPYFGFKIPGEEDKYYYVWLDAPIGYIASTQNYCKQNGLDAENDYWKSKNSRIIHFIGKDIIYFHFLFWPAMLSESGFNLPDDIIVHGFLTVNGEKMSKSRGTFFTAEEFGKKYNPEYLRFYYAKFLSKKLSDIDLDMKELTNAINNELVANIGNFIYRTLSFLKKNFDGSFKDINKDKVLVDEILKISDEIKSNYENANLSEALKKTLHIGTLANQYFQKNEPWKQIKEDKEKTQKVLGTCVNIAKNLVIMLNPILPKITEKIAEQIGIEKLDWNNINFNLKDHKINDAKIVINKMEIKQDKKFPLDLKVAKILEARPHPDADKLVILQIDLGTEKKQLVAGIREYYTIEELVGKKIIVLSNLKKAKLRGELSEGMLLAGEEGDKVSILELKDAKQGTSVTFGNMENDTKQIKYEDFARLKIIVKDEKVYFEDKLLKADPEEVKVKGIKKGEVH